MVRNRLVGGTPLMAVDGKQPFVLMALPAINLKPSGICLKEASFAEIIRFSRNGFGLSPCPEEVKKAKVILNGHDKIFCITSFDLEENVGNLPVGLFHEIICLYRGEYNGPINLHTKYAKLREKN